MTARQMMCDVLVLGAGPAGMAASQAARECGARVICIDLFAAPGGQYHMQPPGPGGAFQATAQVADGVAAARRCSELGVEFLTGTEVFWVEPGFTAYASQGSTGIAIRAETIIVASGAMERALPFKGWTLPGVMTAGGAQRLIKASNASPGRNVVVAGSGPFLMAVASTFATAGLPLRALVELRRPGAGAAALLARHPGRIGEALKLLRGLRRTGARRFYGHQVVEALGEGRLEAVRIAPLDRTGRPDLAKAFTLQDIDALCVGYGFRPVIDVTSLLHASHRFDDALGGWVCNVDDEQATDVPGLYAAGEITGIGGAVPARLSGRLAGLNAGAAAAGKPASGETGPLRRQLTRARSFAAGLAALYPFPGSFIGELEPATVLCRCEDVRVADIDAALADGACDTFSVKMWTRAGMGPCQGRMCGAALAELTALRLNRSVAETGYNRPHMPLRPVPANVACAALADMPELNGSEDGPDRPT